MSYRGELSMFWSPLQSRACLIDGSFSAGFTRMGGLCWRIHWDSSSVSIVTHISVIGHIHIIRFSVPKEPSTENLDAIVNLRLRPRVVVFIPSSVFTNIVINQSAGGPTTEYGNNNIYFPAWGGQNPRWDIWFHIYIQGVFFLTGSALKVLSAGDGKIPNKKVKVRVCHREYVKF